MTKFTRILSATLFSAIVSFAVLTAPSASAQTYYSNPNYAAQPNYQTYSAPAYPSQNYAPSYPAGYPQAYNPNVYQNNNGYATTNQNYDNRPLSLKERLLGRVNPNSGVNYPNNANYATNYPNVAGYPANNYSQNNYYPNQGNIYSNTYDPSYPRSSRFAGEVVSTFDATADIQAARARSMRQR